MLIKDNVNPLPPQYRTASKASFLSMLSGAYQITDRETYYQASATKYKPFPMLRGEKKCDVVIIGGGFAGLSAAIELAKKKVNVILLEQNKVGYGCSGRNGGQLIRGWNWEQVDIEEKFGKEFGDTAWKMGIDAIDLVKNRIKEHKLAVDWQPGYNLAPITQRQERYMHDIMECLAKRNYKMTYYPKKDIKKKLITDRYLSLGEDLYSGHLHPLKLAIGYSQIAKKLGAKIYEFSPALSFEGNIVTTPYGKVVADTILLAGGAYLNWKRKLVKQLYQTIMPVGSYVVATKPLKKDLNPFVVPHGYCDLNWALDYFRPSPDNRMIFGGRATYSTMEPKNVKPWMMERLKKVFPQLSHVDFDYAWGGLIDITQSRLPDMGFLNDRTIYVQGFSGHGVNFAAYSGKVLADTILAKKRGQVVKEFEVISNFKHQKFPGGPIRMPLLVLAMAYYRMKDKF